MILSASGWRDIFALDGNEESTAKEISVRHQQFALAAAKVFYDYLSKKTGNQKPTVVVGIDTRATGEAIADIIIRTLNYFKCDVYYAGITAAPEIMSFTSFCGKKYSNAKLKRADGFIFVSASHNPIGHNGIKFGLNDGGVLDAKEVQVLIDEFNILFYNKAKIISLLSDIKIPAAERRGIFVLPESCTSGLIPSVTPQSGGVLNPTARIKNVDEYSIQTIYANSETIKKASMQIYHNFTLDVISDNDRSCIDVIKKILAENPIGICADFNGSARCVSIDKTFFKEFGIKFEFINGTAGKIAHKIVPEDDSLFPCRDYLEKLHAQDKDFVLGYVPDCDGDRGNLVIWDDQLQKVRPLVAQEVFALAVLGELSFNVWLGKTNDMAVAVNDPTSLRIDSIAKSFGANIYRAEVGEANVVSLGRQLRNAGKTVRILGEGSAGGNITHPSSVRDPINTVMTIVKLLSIRSTETKKGLFEIWCELSNQKEKYKAYPNLADIIGSLPKFDTTGTYSDDAVLRINVKDHAAFKAAYQKIFLQKWEEIKTELYNDFGITAWEAAAYNGTTERLGITDFSVAGKGGLKINFTATDINKKNEVIACIWMRGSATEAVFRIMADARSTENLNADFVPLERRLIRLQHEMVMAALAYC